MAEAWNVVEQLYFDSNTLSRIDWDERLLKAMRASFASENAASAYNEISAMLMDLGDPYTRIIPPSQYDDFRVSSEGEVQGIGVLLAADPGSKQLVVVNPLADGPADRAGIRKGDVLLQIDGTPTDSLDGENAGRLLRGAQGTSVNIKLSRPSSQIPGVPGRPEPPAAPEIKTVTVKREMVTLSPVFAARVPMQGQQLGYIRLQSFSHTAAPEMERAVQQLTQEGAKGFILDLRNDPGGLVEASLDIASLWLDGETTVFNIAGRDGADVTPINLSPGAALTRAPLAVLVNANTASAAEILAGALHDSGRARIFGDAATYGKGRIQTVYELADGSALFVTVAQYQTPWNAEIDHVGIAPDVRCPAPRGIDDDGLPAELSLYGPQPLTEQLFADPCFLAAEKAVAAAVRKPPAVPRLPAAPPQLFADTAMGSGR